MRESRDGRLRVVVGDSATAEGLHQLLRELSTDQETTLVTPPTIALNLILHGPPGTGKTFRMRGLRSQFNLSAPAAPTPALDVADLTWFEVLNALQVAACRPLALKAVKCYV